MPLPSLPDECFSDMLSYLDRESLYQCLFVNRYYCKFSIPIIWRDPFIAPTSAEKLSLINTLFSCLNEDEISSLIPCAINFNNGQFPLFRYGNFVRKIDHDYCLRHIKSWLIGLNEADEYDVNQDCRVRKLISVIYHMIMRENSNLQEFVIETWESYIVLPKLSIFTTYKPGISNLRSLTMDVDFDLTSDNARCQNIVEFLNMISKFCNSVVSYNLYVVELNGIYYKPFLDIIELQPLEMMIIGIENPLKENVEKVMNTLGFRSETLKYLLFQSLDFQDVNLSFMSKLECLERLEFEYCRGFISQYCDALSRKKFHLKELKLWHHEAEFYDRNGSFVFNGFSGVKLNVIKSMINSFCSETLLKLSLNIVTPETIKAVRESCSNINFLHIKIHSEQLLDSIILPICELSSLKIIKIEVGCGILADSLVRILGDHLIFAECLLLKFYIDLSSFEYFVNNCKANLKKWLIRIPNLESLKDYLTYVNNYQKVHNSLRRFGINKAGRWTNEELEIIDLLKNQGVDVFSSYELDV